MGRPVHYSPSSWDKQLFLNQKLFGVAINQATRLPARLGISDDDNSWQHSFHIIRSAVPTVNNPDKGFSRD
jgi:hypothetical protein